MTISSESNRIFNCLCCLRMKIRAFALLLFSGIAHLLSAGDFDLLMEMVDDRLAVRQRPGTEQLLKEYLDYINCECDTIYALIYTPMNCPRGESAIVDFPVMLKGNSIDNRLLLITSYSDENVAKIYNESKGYKADCYLYDTDERFSEIFSFSPGYLHVIYIMKLIHSEGKMLVGVEASWMNEDFINELVAFDGRIPQMSYPTGTSNINRKPTEAVPVMDFRHDDYMVIDTSGLPISETQYPIVVTDSVLAFSDKVWNGVRLYQKELDAMKFAGFLQSDSVENRRFVKVPEWYYKHKLDNGTVYFMVNGISLTDNRKLGISYSLPKLIVESEDIHGMTVGYSNKPAIIVREIATQEKDSLMPLDFNTDRFFYQHFTYTPVAGGKKLLFGCRKQVWPMIDFDTTAVVPDSINPFCAGFYDFDNPYIAVYDTAKGCVTDYLGNLEAHSRRSLTGYGFVSPVAAACGNEVVYGDGLGGRLYVTELSDSKQQSVYELFSIDLDSLPEPDKSLFGTYDCLEPYQSYFNRNIQQLELTSDAIYGIMRYGLHNDERVNCDGYTFFKIDRNDGNVKEWRFPRIPESTMLSYGIRKSDGCPVMLFKQDSGNYVLRVFIP